MAKLIAMFGNNKKIDPKVRFQHSNFKRQLSQARGYKRPVRDLGKKNNNAFWEKIGLGTWTRKIAAIIILSLAVYVIYFPNFLSIKNVDINGLKKGDREQVQQTIVKYLNKTSLLPQKNLSLLSTKRLTDTILQQNKAVLKINSINKVYPNSVIVNLSARQDSFYLEVGGNGFSVSSDGIISRQTGAQDSASTTLLNIKIQTAEIPNVGQKYFSADFANMLLTLGVSWPPVLGSGIKGIEFQNLKNTEGVAATQLGYKIKFDWRLDLNETLNRLKLILADFPDAQKKSLSYIDLRLKDRAFVCQKINACSKETIIAPTPSASTTPEIIKQ